jgi:threonine dehydratase
VITRDDVLAAHSRIRDHIRRTPVVQVAAPSSPLWIKCEFMQYTGCFKARGALNRVVAVEPTAAPTLNAALRAGTPVDVSVSGIAADSLGARRVGQIAFDVARRFGVESLLVDDSAIVSAREQLWNEYRMVAEHGAAAAYAALSSGAYAPSRDERVAVLISGANTAPATLATGGS